jgi:cobalt-zinc-cadmium efflux system outer membrane protein
MSFGLEVPLDLSGRRAVARHLARAEAAARRAESAVARDEAVTAAVLAWVDVIEARRALELEETALEALDEATRVLREREEAGTVAGYDRVRLELEAELVRSAVAEADARVAAARELLRVIVAPDARRLPEISGSLEVGSAEPLDRWLAHARQHHGIDLARRACAAADQAVDASGSAWVPQLRLAGGARIEGAVETRWGYVAGLSVSLPIFGGDHGLPGLARSQRAAAEARADALERRITREVTVAHLRLASSHAELARFREAIEPRLDVLLRGAESGYREGQRTIAELLDSRRAAATARRRMLELEADAKRAEVRLRGAVGGWR